MVWILGSKGMLGREVCLKFQSEGVQTVETDTEVDITEFAALKAFADSITEQVKWIINCSAYTAVDKAEEEAEKAFAVNARGAGNIAEIAGTIGSKLVHISTDYVFDGTAERPYSEDDPVAPLGVYGRSKEAGEKMIREKLHQHYILRTSWLYGRYGKNFVSTMLKLFDEKDRINVVADQRGTPTLAVDLASFIYTVVAANTESYGTYHCSGEGETTWYGFSREIYRQAREMGLVTGECKINPVSTEEFPSRAQRPTYSVFNKVKVKSVFDISFPRWEASLERFLRNIQEGNTEQ